MKRGILAAVAAIALAFAAPITALAIDIDGEESATPSAEKGYELIVTPFEGAGGVTTGMKGNEIKSWPTTFSADYEVVFVGDARVVDKDGKVVLNPSTLDPAITASFSASTWKGDIIAHWSTKGVDQGATITISSKDLSPVIVLKKITSDDKVPNTGDSSNAPLWMGALVIAVLCGGAAIFMRKGNA